MSMDYVNNKYPIDDFYADVDKSACYLLDLCFRCQPQAERIYALIKDKVRQTAVEEQKGFPYHITDTHVAHAIANALEETLAPNRQEFMLSQDTALGVDLMMFISDWREDFAYTREDLVEIGENKCFSHIMLRVQEYLDDLGIQFDDIDFGRYTSDERVMDMVHVVARAFHEYLNGDIDVRACKQLIESAKSQQMQSLDGQIQAAEAQKNQPIAAEAVPREEREI